MLFIKLCYTRYMAQYSKTSLNGETVNAWTADLWKQVKVVYKTLGGTGSIYIVQGSWSGGSVSASAGTHDGGGGVIDVAPYFQTDHNFDKLALALRYCGFAAWHRTPDQGPWDHHVHAVLIGDKTVAPLAAAQVIDYRQSKTGLKGHAHDPSERPKQPVFIPNYGLRTVSLSVAIKESKKRTNYIPRPGVIRIQRALNLKLGTSLKVDGRFGKATREAYKKWESRFPAANDDGIPGSFTLILLGAGRFNVGK